MSYRAVADLNLCPNGATGSKNETSIRRYRSILRAADRADIQVVYAMPWANSFPTREAFEAALEC